MQLQHSGFSSVYALLALLIVPCMGSISPIASHRHVKRFSSAASHDGTSNATVNDETSQASKSTNSTDARPVYLIMHTRLIGVQVIPPTYDKLFPVYSSLHFNATTTDGPLDIQVINQNGQDLIRITEWGLQNNDKPMGVLQSGYLTDYFELFGQTNITNDQILSPSTGRGLVHDIWTDKPSLSLKAYNSNDFMLACIGKLGLGIASSNDTSAILPTRWRYAQIYWRNLWVSERSVNQYPVWLERLHGWGDQVQKTRAIFQYKPGADPSGAPFHPVPTDIVSGSTGLSLASNGMSDLAAPGLTETYQSNDNTTATAPQYQWIYAQPPRRTSLRRRANPSVRVPDQILVYNPGDEFDLRNVAIGARLAENGEIATRPRDVISPPGRAVNAVVARNGGASMLSFFRTVGIFGGIAGVVTVVIIDFTKTDDGTSLLMGLICPIIAVLGMSIAAALAVPFLSEFALVAAIILGELPDMLQNHAAQQAKDQGWGRRSLPSTSTPPLRTSVQEILQYTLTGDRNKTGNEPCLAKGYKECTVVYGPYLLATALNVESFDAFALLIHFNEGYPMSMPDLIQAFRLSTDSDSAGQVATIDCSHSSRPDGRFSWSNPNHDTVLQQCDKPRFSVKRQLVKVPIVNETADKIHDRLMPHGNCSLVGDTSGGERYPAYNITIRGSAVAIACGIVGAIDINGTATPLPGASLSPSANMSQSLTLVSPGNDSSDGSSGRGYIAPPQESPFQKSLNLTNSICMTAPSDSNLCLPNGTYSAQSGSLGFDTAKANSLILATPGNCSVVVPVSKKIKDKASYAHAPGPPPTYADHSVVFSTNQSATVNPAFASDMRDMAKYHQANTFTVHCPTAPDAVCLYTEPYGKGDVACFGPGGGDLPPGLKGHARSVRAYGRASVEIFAYSYGNSFARIFDTYEDDLAGLRYNASLTFADVAMSIWVYLS